MQRILLIALIFAGSMISFSRAADPSPTTQPTAETLAKLVRFNPPPAPWALQVKSPDGRSFSYLAGKWGAMRISVNAQDIPAGYSTKTLADSMIRALNEGLKKQEKTEVIIAPHVVEELPPSAPKAT